MTFKNPKGSTEREKEIADLKAVTQCAVCNETGHWQGDPECKMADKMKAKSALKKPASNVRMVERDPDESQLHYYNGDEDTESRAFWAWMVGRDRSGDEAAAEAAARDHLVHRPLSRAFAVTRDMKGHMVLDTACEKTVAGLTWLHSLAMQLQAICPRLQLMGSAEVEHFRFGAGERQTSRTRFRLPAGIHKQHIEIRTSCLDLVLPCLGSKELMQQLQVIIDTVNMVVYFLALSKNPVRIKLSETGQMCFEITDIIAEQYPYEQARNLEDDGKEVYVFPRHSARASAPPDECAAVRHAVTEAEVLSLARCSGPDASFPDAVEGVGSRQGACTGRRVLS